MRSSANPARWFPALLLAAAWCSAAEPVPLVLSYSMDALQGNVLEDDGPLKINAKAEPGVEFSPESKRGGSLHFTGTGYLVVDNPHDLYELIGSPLTIALWVKPEAPPAAGATTVLLTKRFKFWQGYPIGITLDENLQLGVMAQNGAPVGGVAGQLPLNEWTHVAVTHAPNGELIAYLNGKEVKRFALPGTLASNDEPILIGFESGSDGPSNRRVPFRGWMDDVQIYAAALDAEQIKRLMAGTAPPVRAATLADVAPPQMPFRLKLVRFDMPLGFKNRDVGEPMLTRMLARRAAVPDAVDWPVMFFGDRALFRDAAQDVVLGPRKLRQNFGPLFQQPDDPVLTPGNHWFRGIGWKWGHTYSYTTDASMRGATNELEVWTFPVRISSATPDNLKSVRLTWNGKTIYEHDRPLNSLILLLPQNKPGPPYELSVNGSAPVKFDAGLQPVTLGDPREIPLAVNLDIPSTDIRVENLKIPEYDPYRPLWKKSLVDMRRASAPPPAVAPPATGSSFTRHLGIEVARAPILTYSVSMTHGMSGGHFFDSVHAPDFGVSKGHLFPGTEEDYVKFLADEGIDMIFEKYFTGEDGDGPAGRSAEKFLEACESQGIRAGFNIVTMSNSNLAFYSRALPDFWLPKLRDIQLIAQRMKGSPALVGFVMGADNGAYVPFWDWAPPAPTRPWGEAFLAVNAVPRHPIGPECTLVPQKQHEYRATEKEFLDYIATYDRTFEQYGEFSARLAEVDPRLLLTTMSFGSSPGILGDGGWPIGTVPGQPMFKNLPVLQSFDWDETDAERPVHNLALADRLHSYFPEKPLWTLLDDFYLKYNREALFRVYALMLTRGPSAIGQNWLPQPAGPDARPGKCRDLREVNAWVHRHSGVYAGTRPLAPVGVLYVHQQAVSRNVLPSATNHDSAALRKGSHEGKTTEALFLCHAAGWPAVIITPEEIQRGLPADMKAILLTGLNRFDDTWLWSEGIEDALAAFVARGGRLLVDDESVAPSGLTATETGMQIYAYTKQGDGGPTKPSTDPVARLMKRNQENIAKLRAAMSGVEAPLAASADPAIWAVPHRTGDVDYVTVTNWSFDAGKPLARFFKPHSGSLAWRATGPIYEVTASRKTGAASCDFTSGNPVRIYACPPGEIGRPQIAVRSGSEGFFEAQITVPAGAAAAAGVPLEIQVSHGAERVSLFAATGSPVRLPVSASEESGAYEVTVKELLSGQSASARFEVAGGGVAAAIPVASDALSRFLGRKSEPLTIALTPEQMEDPKYRALGQKLIERFQQAGRKATVIALSPDQLITGIQPYTSVQKFPQWQTIPTDLILLGTPQSNILMYEQALGGLFSPGATATRVTYSPFVGGYHCLNLFGASPEAIEAEIERL